MIPKHRPAKPPGEILLEEFLEPLGMTQAAHELWHARRAMTKAR